MVISKGKIHYQNGLISNTIFSSVKKDLSKFFQRSFNEPNKPLLQWVKFSSIFLNLSDTSILHVSCEPFSLRVALWFSVPVLRMSWGDAGGNAGGVTGGSEAIYLFIAWAYPGETNPFSPQTRTRVFGAESQGGGGISLSSGSWVCCSQKVHLELPVMWLWLFFFLLNLSVEATNLKTHDSEPFKYAAYKEWGAAWLVCIKAEYPASPVQFLPFRYFAFSLLLSG